MKAVRFLNVLCYSKYMKRRLLPVAALLPALLLPGCSLFQCYVHDDFERYNSTGGYCDFETDMKSHILPSEDFIDRFEFENARYYHFARPDLDFSDEYTFSYLYFEYGEEIYLEAKGFMLSEAKPFNDHYEYYKDFVFYENSKAVEEHRKYMELESEFPKWFWMLGYCDSANSVLFCGFVSIYFEEGVTYKSWDDLLERTVLLTLEI